MIRIIEGDRKLKGGIGPAPELTYLKVLLKGLNVDDVDALRKAIPAGSSISIVPCAKNDMLLMGHRDSYLEMVEKIKPRGIAHELEKAIENYLSKPIFKISSEELETPAIMGVLNLTPDSFSDDGISGENALERAKTMVEEGASILDIGGESTRPGHRPVSSEEEGRRVLPVLKTLRKEGTNIPVSIDTTKLEIVQKTIDLVDIINDQWGLQKRDRNNEGFARIVADAEKSIILMHNWGAGAGSMYDGPDIMDEVISFLKRSVEIAESNGILSDKIMVDPGLGFGKRWTQSLEVIERIRELKVLGKPILVGASRKSFIGKTLGLEVGERLEGTLAVTAYVLSQGASIVRVHDVKENVRVARLIAALMRF